MKGVLVLIAITTTLLGCASSPEPQPPTEATKKVAIAAFWYSQMATNAYKPHDAFVLPPGLINIENKDNDSIGFAYSIFERRRGHLLEEVILVFRGTDQFIDWTFDLAPEKRTP